jgi:Zn-dependent protease with chaperone function
MKIAGIALISLLAIFMSGLLAVHAAAGRSSAAISQSLPTAHKERTAELYLNADRNGDSYAELYFNFPSNKELGLAASLSRALGCPEANWQPDDDVDEGESALSAECQLTASKRFLETRGQLNVRGVQEILAKENISRFEVTLSFPKGAFTSCAPAPSKLYQDKTGDSCFYEFAGWPATADSVRFSYGYHTEELARSAAVLLVVFVLPLPLTLWLRRQALTAPDAAKEAVSFAYMRYQIWGIVGGFLLWWTAADVVNAEAVLSYVLGPNDATALSGLLPWVFLWIPPVLMYALCNLFSAPVHRLRGNERSQGEIVRQSFWSSAAMVVPVGFMVASVSYSWSSPRTAVLCLAAWFFLAIFLSQKTRQAHGLDPNALTRGDLRDRAFAVAEKAGVQLDQVYVLPSHKMRIANAFAHSRRTISLTDYLLKNMSKREVNAVIGHEVAHLQLHHIRNRLIVYFAGLGAFMFASDWLNGFVSPRFPAGPVCLMIPLLGMYYVSRRHEFAADRGSVRLTGDPEAMISALAKLARLNTIPLHWSRLNDPMLTHPSMQRRVSAVAKMSDVPAGRLTQLIQESGNPPLEIYDLPSTVAPAAKVFSTRQKSSAAQKSAWMSLLGMALPLAAVAWGRRSAGLEGSQQWLAYLAGFIAALAISWAALDFSMWSYKSLGARIRQKLKAQGAPEDVCAGLFVGLGPDSSPRIYENNWSWDFGLLALRRDCLLYYGEEATFALQRSQIIRMELGPGPATWYRTPNVYVFWKTPAGTESVFNLRAMNAPSLTQMGRKTRLMYRDLSAWLAGCAPSTETLLPVSASASGLPEMLSIPSFGSVTGKAPRFFLKPRLLFRNYSTVGIVSAGIAILCGLHFLPVVHKAGSAHPHPFFDGSGWYVVIGAWIIRSIQLWPFWRDNNRRKETRSSKSD